MSGVAKTAPRVLITGCMGQVGTALVRLLRFKYGTDNVIATDVVVPSKEFYHDGPFMYADVTQYNTLAKIAVDEGISWIVHNSSVPSLTGEGDPAQTLDININGMRNVLELARALDLRVLAPSSIATFSSESGGSNVPDMAVRRPRTIYGVSKCFQENIGLYFHRKYGVDFRSIRYPGVISTLEEGNSPALKFYRPTTDDYPMASLHQYRRDQSEYRCGLRKDTSLPFLYIEDCLLATAALLEAPEDALSKRVYNVQGVSFTPEEFVAEVRRHIPDFEFKYEEDHRQQIAASWPNSCDDSAFRNDLGWYPDYDLPSTVETLLQRMNITKKKSRRRRSSIEIEAAVSSA
ncbi:threonine 3-dehydrogenase [Diplonema papillatum]|nr:threonine 3-dehydrogenase [Diplonema papillatum]|eukprot:gene3354-5252_t